MKYPPTLGHAPCKYRSRRCRSTRTFSSLHSSSTGTTNRGTQSGRTSSRSPRNRTLRDPCSSLPMNQTRTRCEARHHVVRSNQHSPHSTRAVLGPRTVGPKVGGQAVGQGCVARIDDSLGRLDPLSEEPNPPRPLLVLAHEPDPDPLRSAVLGPRTVGPKVGGQAVGQGCVARIDDGSLVRPDDSGSARRARRGSRLPWASRPLVRGTEPSATLARPTRKLVDKYLDFAFSGKAGQCDVEDGSCDAVKKLTTLGRWCS
jgi:hypothetical protein